MHRVVAMLLASSLAACTPSATRPAEKLQVIEVDKADTALRSARATLEIKSKAGTCLWTISGDGDLIRLPRKDERYSALLLSAQFAGRDRLVVQMAGEGAPLETSALARYEVPLHGDAPVVADAFLGSTKEGAWEMKVVPVETQPDPGCCTCGVQKLRCCPNHGWCLDCGTCGSCCN